MERRRVSNSSRTWFFLRVFPEESARLLCREGYKRKPHPQLHNLAQLALFALCVFRSNHVLQEQRWWDMSRW